MSFPSQRLGRLVAGLLIAGGYLGLGAPPDSSSPIRFSFQAIPFHHENDETPDRHVPAAMAGGVAILDYNRDERPDIFFTNGANLATLTKDSPKYSNRLFRNDGNGKFTDVTKEAGLAGIGYGVGVAGATTITTAIPTFLWRACIAIRCITTMATARSPTSRKKQD